MANEPTIDDRNAFEEYDIDHPLSEADMQRFRSILQEALPPVEWPTEKEYAGISTDRRYRAYGHRGPEGVFDTVAMTIRLSDGTALIGYLCTEPSRRGCGIGGRLLDLILEKESGHMVIVEIDPLETSSDAVRRAEFYRRHGMTVNDGYYEIPPLKPDEPGVRQLIVSYPDPLVGEGFDRIKVLIEDELAGDYARL